MSDWGHDFRPDYRRIRTLIAELGSDVPVLATTATANDRVVDDVAAQLGVGGTRHPGAARRPGPGVAAAVGGSGRQPGRARGLACRTPRVAAGFGHRLHAHRRTGARRGRRCCASGATRWRPTPAPPRPPNANNSKPICWTTGSRRSSPRRRWAWASTNRTSASSSTWARRPHRSRTTSRSAARAGPPTAPRSILLPGQEDRDVWRYFASVAFPSEAMVRNVIRALEPDRPQSTAGAGAAGRPQPDPAGDGAEGPRRRRCGAARQGRLGRAPAKTWYYDEERYRTSRRGPPPRAAGHARLPGHRRTAEWCSCAVNSTIRSFVTASAADAATTARVSGTTPTVDGRRGRVHQGAVDAARRGDHPAPAVADRAEQARAHAVSGRISDGPEPGRVIGRLTDLGWGARLRRLLDEPDQTVPDDVVRAAVDVLAAWTWADPADRGDRRSTPIGHPLLISIARRAVGPAGPADRPRHPALRAAAPAGRPRPTPRTGLRRCMIRGRRRSPQRSTGWPDRCCWSTI